MSNSSYIIQFFIGIVLLVFTIKIVRRISAKTTPATPDIPVKWDLNTLGLRVRVDHAGKYLHIIGHKTYYSDKRLAWKVLDPNVPVEDDWKHSPEKPENFLSGVQLEGRIPLIGLTVDNHFSIGNTNISFSSRDIGNKYVFSITDTGGEKIELPDFKGSGYVYISVDWETVSGGDGDSYEDKSKFVDWLNRLAKEAETKTPDPVSVSQQHT